MSAGQHNRERATRGHSISTPNRHGLMVHPQKNTSKKLRTRMATDSRGMQHVRRLSWQRELVDTYWRHQVVPLTDSPGSALSFRLAHLSGTNLNQEPTDVGTSASRTAYGYAVSVPCSLMAYANPFTVSCFLNSSRSAHSNGRLKGPGAATIPDECRTRTRSTSIIPTGNGIA